jgi:hypothetical protein
MGIKFLVGIVLSWGLCGCGAKTGLEDDLAVGPTDAGPDVEPECEPGEERQTYSGPDLTENIGVCRPRIEICDEAGFFQTTQEEVLPTDEVCDRLDNDCNGRVDDFEGEVRIADGNHPSLTRTGDGYAVCWDEGPGLSCTWLDEAGNRLGDDIRVAEEGEVPMVFWNGASAGVTYQALYDAPYPVWPPTSVFFSSLSEADVQNSVRLSSADQYHNGYAGSLGWNGSEYLACWHELGYEYVDDAPGLPPGYYQRSAEQICALLDGEGNRLGENSVINFADVIYYPYFGVVEQSSPVWNGTGWGLCIDGVQMELRSTSWDLYCGRLSASGNREGDWHWITHFGDRDDAGFYETSPNLLIGDENRLLFWSSPDTNQISGSWLNSNLEQTASDFTVVGSVSESGQWRLSDNQAGVWTGNRFGLALADRTPDGHMVFLSVLRPNGEVAESEFVSNSGDDRSAIPVVAWNSEERTFGVAWETDRPAGSEINFRRICVPQ